MKISRNLLSEIAKEAHTLGRIYSTGGEELNPAEEFEKVEMMIDVKIKQHYNRANQNSPSQGCHQCGYWKQHEEMMLFCGTCGNKLSL